MLKSSEFYRIRVEKFADFYKIDELYIYSFLYVDKFDTISYVRELLSKDISRYHEKASPEEIILYDNNKNQIYDVSKKLYSVQELDKKFYYSISKKSSTSTASTAHTKPELKFDSIYGPIITETKSELELDHKTTDIETETSENLLNSLPKDSINLLIIFCDNNNEKKISPLSKTFDLKTKIKDIQKYILSTYEITDKINIKYKRDGALVGTGLSYTLDEIKEKIVEKVKDKMMNTLYVEIQSKSKDISDLNSDDESTPKSALKPKYDYADFNKRKSDEIKVYLN